MEKESKELKCGKCGWKGKAKECQITVEDKGMSIEALINLVECYVCPQCGEYKFMRYAE